jgi:hypothetical protein
VSVASTIIPISTEDISLSTQATATLSQSEATSTTLFEADTTTTTSTKSTTVETTTAAETTTTAAAPPVCSNLAPLHNYHTVDAPSEFRLSFETCDGSYGGSNRLVGSGNNGAYYWRISDQTSEVISLADDGTLLFVSGLYTAAQQPDNGVVAVVAITDTARAGWTRLNCNAVAASGSDNTYLTCIGDADNSLFQICPSSTDLPPVFISTSVAPGCKEARPVIIALN